MVAAGFGRTGEKFGYLHYGVEPDLICCGKGMGSGFPLCGVIGRAEIMDLPGPGSMSSKHSANPLACVTGLVTLDEIERHDLVREARRKGEILMSGLDELRSALPDRISRVTGKGLIAAVLTCDPVSGRPDSAFASRVSE